MTNSERAGLILSISANVIWGLFPIYWEKLRGISSVDLVCHRIVWAFAFAFAFVCIRLVTSKKSERQKRIVAFASLVTWKTHALAALLITLNWLAFLWAVTNDRVLLSSLGYYINPLVNVLLGVLVLGEHLSSRRWIAIVLAAIGVTILSVAAGEIPWVSFLMAFSFAGYALVKKRASLDALDGLLIEMSVIVGPTLVYLLFLIDPNKGFFIRDDSGTALLLILGGLLTLLPLALFSAATRRIPLTLIGMLQYVGPTLQFLVGRR
ncbi:MAG: EamA family transporter RarD [Planctomycetota bacterium]